LVISFLFTLAAGAIEFTDGLMIFRSHHSKIEIIEEYLKISAIVILIDVVGELIFGLMEGEDILDESFSFAVSLLSLR
jgi:hypothetical protein